MSSNCKWPGCDRELHEENVLCPHHGDKVKNLGGLGAALGSIGAGIYSQSDKIGKLLNSDKIEDILEKVAEKAKNQS